MVAASLLISSAFAMGMMGGGTYGGYGGMMGGGTYGGYGGMMGGGYGTGYGYTSPPYTTSTTNITTSTGQYYQPVYPFMFGGGMMGKLGNGNGFSGMMSRYGYSAPYTTTGTTLSINQAATIAQNYVASTGNPDFVVKQVEEYTANFYVQVNEKSTGNGAFELLINKVHWQHLPRNGTQHDVEHQIRHDARRNPRRHLRHTTTNMPVTAAQAQTDAQTYLTTYLPGTTTGDVTTFYGYYTIEVLSTAPPTAC